MKELSEQEFQAVLNSDMKLWEIAETSQEGTTTTKEMYLPYGIGETSVSMEVTNGLSARAACESYGAYIRGLYDEQTNDQEVTARAEQARQRAVSDDLHNGIFVGNQGVPDAQAKEKAVQGTAEAHAGDAEGDGGLGEVLFAKRAALRDRVNGARANLARWNKELKALDAACAALEEPDEDTPSDTGPDTRGPKREETSHS